MSTGHILAFVAVFVAYLGGGIGSAYAVGKAGKSVAGVVTASVIFKVSAFAAASGNSGYIRIYYILPYFAQNGSVLGDAC